MTYKIEKALLSALTAIGSNVGSFKSASKTKRPVLPPAPVTKILAGLILSTANADATVMHDDDKSISSSRASCIVTMMMKKTFILFIFAVRTKSERNFENCQFERHSAATSAKKCHRGYQ